MSDRVFNEVFNGRTHKNWLDKKVDLKLLDELVRLTLLGPTSANCEPLRVVFVQSAAAKEKLKPCLMEGNVAATMSAPVTAILAYDHTFYEHLPTLFPYADMKGWFASAPEALGTQNAYLQIGYFILAARGLGLDCGPMTGFDPKATDAAFFEGSSLRSLVLCNLGYGDAAKLHPQRAPRLPTQDVYKVV